MNREKLVSLIVKKETYKDTKQVQNDIAKKKEEAVNVSIVAIQQILKEQYNAQAKLYAIRYLKDCFEKGNPSFITKTEIKILPLMQQIIQDSNDENKIMNYAGSSFSKNSDLQKFKSLVSSLFVMTRECIENWGKWISDPNRQFYKMRNRLNKEVPYNFGEQFQYFRKENGLIFKQNCQKNGMVLPQIKEKQANTFKENQIGKKQLTTPQPTKIKQTSKASNKVEKILADFEKRFDKSNSISEKEIQSLEGKFNEAVNEYIEETNDFDEAYLSQCFTKFDKLKNNKGKKQQQKVREIKSSKKEEMVKHIQQKQIKIQQMTKKQEKFHDEQKRSLNSQKSKKNQVKTKKKKLQNLKIQTNSEQFQFAPQIAYDSKNSQTNTFKNQLKVPSEIKNNHDTQQLGNVNFTLNSKISDKNSEKNESRVKFDESSDEQEDQRVQKTIQNSKLETAKFIEGKNIKKQIKFQDQKSKIDYQLTMREKMRLEEAVQNLEREIYALKEEKRTIKQVGNAIQSREYEKVKKQLLDEKRQKLLLNQQIQQLKSQLKRTEKKFQFINSQLSQSRGNFSNQNSDSKIKKTELQPDKIQSHLFSENESHFKSKRSPKVSSPINLIKQPYSPRVDEDYIKDVTNFENLQSFLAKTNINLFKLIFYENQIVSISQNKNSFSKQNHDYLKLTLAFQFRYRQDNFPRTIYKNIQNIDLWTKPMNGSQRNFSQQIVGKLCGNPLKLMRATVKTEQNTNVSFFLPFTFFNYLKASLFLEDQFEDIFETKKDSVVKSKVFKLNSNIISKTKDFKTIFEDAVIKNNLIELCLSEESKENAFMIQIQILKNQKAMVRILTIPSIEEMKLKGKELIDIFVFLFSQ